MILCNNSHPWKKVFEYALGKSARTSKPGMEKRTKQNANAFTTYDQQVIERLKKKKTLKIPYLLNFTYLVKIPVVITLV